MQSPSLGSGPLRALLRVPLFYKILIANSLIVFLGSVVGTAAVRHAVTTDPFEYPAMVLLLGLGGVLVTVLVNALILRLALNPLSLLEQTAARVQAGDLDARVPYSALLDRRLERLTLTFNGMLDTVEAYRGRVREIAARALNAEEEERKRIARELHDDTAQTLASLLIRLRVARGLDKPEAREELMEQFRVDVGEALERVRRFARGLRPPALDELGLVPALESHVRGLRDMREPTIRVEAEPIGTQLASQTELALYRIAQEALSNAIRHAGATQVRIRIREGAGGVLLTISDDGVGFDVQGVMRSRDRGLGLFGMRERASYVGGTVDVRSRRGQGTEVLVTVPASLVEPEMSPGMWPGVDRDAVRR